MSSWSTCFMFLKVKKKWKVWEIRCHNVIWKTFSAFPVLRSLLIPHVTQTLSISLGCPRVRFAHPGLRNFDSSKWSQVVTSLPLGEVNALPAFFASLNHILQKEASIFPSDGKYMRPDLSSSTRKKLPSPVFPSGEGMTKGQVFLVEEIAA